MTRITKLLLIASLAAALGLTSGCFRRVPIEQANNATSTNEAIPANDAVSSAVRLSMGAGELTVTGADLGTDAVRGEFDFAPKSLEPEVSSTTADGIVTTEIRNSEITRLPSVRLVSRWDVQLSDKLPADVRIDMGAGDAKIDLSDVDVTNLEMNLGAGSTTVDLSGPREGDVSGTITAGAGEIVIRLPKDVPVRVTGWQDGLGEWGYDSGFVKDGNALVNEAWRTPETSGVTSSPRIELNVQRALGEVRLETVE